MECTHKACYVDADGRIHRPALPGKDTSVYAAGDVVEAADGQHYLLGANPHKEHYGAGGLALEVSWDAKLVPTPPPHMTRDRD